MDAREFSELANGGVHARCACHDSAARFEIEGREYIGQFDGQISVRLGKPTMSYERLQTIPLHVIGYTTSSDIPGMGRTTLDFDFSRPIPASDVVASDRSAFFPAVQTMRLHILVTCEAFRGRTLRSMGPSALRNADARNFPPPEGSVYVLESPVALEDIAAPGRPLMTLRNVNTAIISTDVMPERITTNAGFVLLSRGGRTAHLAAERGETEIGYEMDQGGAVSVSLFDAGERPLGVAFHQKQSAGRHTIQIPNHLWLGMAAYYQIAVDGLSRTALMPLES
jgi:hypothetical protein